jgi:hypothetical protein
MNSASRLDHGRRRFDHALQDSKGLGKTQRVGRKCEAYCAEKLLWRITLR